MKKPLPISAEAVPVVVTPVQPQTTDEVFDDRDVKLGRMTLNFTPAEREMLETLRLEVNIKSDGEVMRRAFSLHVNLFERVNCGQRIVLRGRDGEDWPVEILSPSKDDEVSEGREGAARRVLGLRVEASLRADVDRLIKLGAAPSITLLAGKALATYFKVMREANGGSKLLAISDRINPKSGQPENTEYPLKLDGTLAASSGGDVIELKQIDKREEFPRDLEFMRQLKLKAIVASTQEPVRALTLDCGDYLSRFWSGPIWELYLKEQSKNVQRIFAVDEKTVGDKTGEKFKILKRVLQVHNANHLDYKVVFTKDIPPMRGQHLDTSFLLGSGFVSESHSLGGDCEEPGEPRNRGYVERIEESMNGSGSDIRSSRADELRSLWDFLFHGGEDRKSWIVKEPEFSN